MKLAALTWPAYSELISQVPLVIPIAAIKPHGPHLPLGADVLIAEYLANRLAEHVQVLVAPTLSFGCRTNPSRLGGDFPGAFDLRAESFREQITDILGAAYRDGGRKFVLLHTAYANVAPTNEALLEFVDAHSDVQILAASWWDFARESTRNAVADDTGIERTDDHHAAMVETSLVMHMAPEYVRADLITDDPVARRASYTVLPVPADMHTETGVVYRASQADAAIGKQLTDEIVDNMVSSVLLELGKPETEDDRD